MKEKDTFTRARNNWNKLINKFKHVIIPEHKLGKLTDALVDSVQVQISQNEDYLIEIGQGKYSNTNAFRMNLEQLKTCELSYDNSQQVLLDYTGNPALLSGKKAKKRKMLKHL